jgi:hypothetical protein
VGAIALQVDISGNIDEEIVLNEDGYTVYTGYAIAGAPPGADFVLFTVLSDLNFLTTREYSVFFPLLGCTFSTGSGKDIL